MNKNVHEHKFSINRKQQEELNGHKGCVIWFTGLSGSGKSTIANLLQVKMYQEKVKCTILDGDSIRSGLNKDLGFTQSEREENLRRIAEIAKLFVHSAQVVICCFITPLNSQRNQIKNILGDDYYEVFIDAKLETCQKRDPKGLYQKARSGEIEEFTGMSSQFEAPQNSALVIDTEKLSPQKACEIIFRFLKNKIQVPHDSQ